ncbi:hypothetical protein MPLB_1290020 [Mesorhizobium sp. ORS 3324]|nr:hypothetical protein MPLB_1290020 [Mesorhizobium sp. ORS 3324]
MLAHRTSDGISVAGKTPNRSDQQKELVGEYHGRENHPRFGQPVSQGDARQRRARH